MKIPFIKMQAQGNDFVIIDSTVVKIEQSGIPKLAADICERHFGVGADGLVILDMQKPGMTIYNADGSMAEMCGSALRCSCYLLAEKSGLNAVMIHTGQGPSKGIIDKDNPFLVTVEIGNPHLIANNVKIQDITGDCVSIGNPHFVVFREDLSDNPQIKFGRAISENPYFDNGTNVEFVRVLSGNEIELAVWERGAGATLACGTGSTAAVFAGQRRGLLDSEVTVILPGGRIQIVKTDKTYLLSGEVDLVASGEYLWKI
jgi:diaminopimelate epimerase